MKTKRSKGTITSGTTGQGTTTLFTSRETQNFSHVSALGLLRQGMISSENIVQVSTSARASLGNQTFMEACRYAWALVYQTGVVEPAQMLTLLAQQHQLPPDRKSQASVLYTIHPIWSDLWKKGSPLTVLPRILFWSESS